MKQICEELKANTERVFEICDALSRQQPWQHLPPEHRIDGLPNLIVGIAEASLCEPADREAHRQKIWAAAVHGETRRSQGYEEALVLSEYHLLRQAMWQFIREGFPPGRAVEAITRIDTAITLATMASLRGYHADELRRRGTWPDCIEQLTDESPLLGPRPRAGYDSG